MKKILMLSAFLVLVVGAAKSQFLANFANGERVVDVIGPIAVPAMLDQADEAGPEVKLVLLALLPEGFDNKQMQLDPGEYLFVIGNRTGLKDVNVRLDRERNERLGAAAVGGRQTDWKKRLRLSPGTYVVSANDNPDWICRIVVGR